MDVKRQFATFYFTKVLYLKNPFADFIRGTFLSTIFIFIKLHKIKVNRTYFFHMRATIFE